jgi:carbamoyl-phosphate synthase large subunit
VIKVLITACGGPSSLSFSRSLRDADSKRKKYILIGTDCDMFNIHRAECDRTYLCPKANDPKYLPFILKIIKKEGIDVLHSQPEIEAYTIGKYREKILATGCKLFMPEQNIIELLRDKGKSYHLWKDAGIKVPENIDLNSEDDLKKAYEKFGNEIWVRETVGAAGKGSLSRPSYEIALYELNKNNSWGHAVAAEHLTSRTVTWQSIWYKGDLVVAQGRERLNWAFGNRAQSGVTGLTGVGITISDNTIDELSKKCILAATKKPHGIYSVDFTYDKEGIPNPTEINIAKFFTTHHFITKTGCNMPEIFINLALGIYEGKMEVLNPCQEDMYWIRGIDVLPVLLHKKDIERKVTEYEKLINEIN